MTEEAITTTPEATPEAPAISDEAVAEYLGIPVEDVGKAKNVAELYKRANNYNREAKALFDQAKAQAQQPTTPTVESDDTPDFDDATKKALDKLLEARLGPLMYEVQARRVSEIQETIDGFHDSHASEETYSWDGVQKALEELGLDEVMRNRSATPAQIKKALNTAYKYMVTESTDVEKLAEKRAAELLEKVQKDGEVVGIKPKRNVKETERSLDDPTLSVSERAALVRKALGK